MFVLQLMARISFSSRKTTEREASFAEEKAAWERRAADREVEVGRLRHELEEGERERQGLVAKAGATFDRGLREGELAGWREAVRAYKDAGILTDADADRVAFTLVSDGEDDYMEDDADAAGDDATPSAAAS